MDEDVRTLWCGNLSDKVTEDILYELFMQGGPVQKVSIPKDRDGKQRSYGFVTFKHTVSVPYALKLFDGTVLFDRPLSMKTRNNIELPSQSYVGNSPRFDPVQALGNVFNTKTPVMLNSLIPAISLCGIFPRPDSLMYQSHMQPWAQLQEHKRNQRSHPYQREREHNRNDYRDNNRKDRHSSHRPSESSRSTDHRSHRRNYR